MIDSEQVLYQAALLEYVLCLYHTQKSCFSPPDIWDDVFFRTDEIQSKQCEDLNKHTYGFLVAFLDDDYSEKNDFIENFVRSISRHRDKVNEKCFQPVLRKMLKRSRRLFKREVMQFHSLSPHIRSFSGVEYPQPVTTFPQFTGFTKLELAFQCSDHSPAAAELVQSLLTPSPFISITDETSTASSK